MRYIDILQLFVTFIIASGKEYDRKYDIFIK